MVCIVENNPQTNTIKKDPRLLVGIGDLFHFCPAETKSAISANAKISICGNEPDFIAFLCIRFTCFKAGATFHHQLSQTLSRSASTLNNNYVWK